MAHRAGGSLALLFIDQDKFKQVNDTLGHEVGDLLLIKAAERMSAVVRESDTIARMGGDEFTAILPQIDSSEDANISAREIVERLSQPFDLNGAIVNISCSVGIAVYPADAKNVDELLKQADKAMYAVKTQGRSRYCAAADI